jgi:hypothetical protein
MITGGYQNQFFPTSSNGLEGVYKFFHMPGEGGGGSGFGFTDVIRGASGCPLPSIFEAPFFESVKSDLRWAVNPLDPLATNLKRSDR